VGRETECGFTAAAIAPWLPVPPSAAAINVEKENFSSDSLLAWYQRLIRLKKTNPALAGGQNKMLDTANTKVLSWLRQAKGRGRGCVCELYRGAADGQPDVPVLGKGEDPAEDTWRRRSGVTEPSPPGAFRGLYREVQ